VLGVSFGELAIVGLVALLVLGPERLPGAMRTLGQWLGRLRHITSQVRVQSGIDDALRREGLPGGLSELRAIVRGDLSPLRHHFDFPTSAVPEAAADPYLDAMDPDPTREYPVEGCDSMGALPEDLVALADDQLAPSLTSCP
jgi:sec-independent protein translocase protein TatB